ncbi:MAG: glycosyltransferase family 2 protein [Massilia sp.]
MTDAGRAPRLSVVIPCYNAERYIAATLDSVLAQGDDDLEIIVVDDGSRDGSRALIHQRYPQVRLIEQANAGVAAARNHGIKAARGEWIAFVDADDIWLPGKLAAQFALLAKNPDCRMCYTAWHVWPSDAPLPTPAVLQEVERNASDTARWQSASGWIYPQLLLDCAVWTSTTMAKRSLFDEIGNFDGSLRVGEDYDLWLRASRVTPILQVPRPYALYRIHPDSITKSRPTANYRALVINRAIAQWGLASPDGATANASAVKHMLAQSWSDFASDRLRTGDAAGAASASMASLRLAGANMAAWKLLLRSGLQRIAGAPAKGKA